MLLICVLRVIVVIDVIVALVAMFGIVASGVDLGVAYSCCSVRYLSFCTRRSSSCSYSCLLCCYWICLLLLLLF